MPNVAYIDKVSDLLEQIENMTNDNENESSLIVISSFGNTH